MRPDIEAYLNGELSGTALEQFEAELAENPALRAELAQLRPTWHALRRAGIARQVEEALRRRALRRRRNWLLLLVCSVFATLIGIRWWLTEKENKPGPLRSNPPHHQPVQPSPVLPTVDSMPPPRTSPSRVAQAQDDSGRELALAEYKTPLEFENSRGDGSDLSEAINFFRQNDYSSALKLVDQATASDPESYYLRAHVLFKLKRYQRAKVIFLDLSVKNPAYKDRGEWYALLCGLAENPPDKKAIRRLLTAIQNIPEHTYYENARDLQESLVVRNLLSH